MIQCPRLPGCSRVLRRGEWWDHRVEQYLGGGFVPGNRGRRVVFEGECFHCSTWRAFVFAPVRNWSWLHLRLKLVQAVSQVAKLRIEDAHIPVVVEKVWEPIIKSC